MSDGWRAWLRVLSLAIVVALVGACGGVGRPSRAADPASARAAAHSQTQTATRSLTPIVFQVGQYYYSKHLRGKARRHRLVHVGDSSPLGVAVAGDRFFWLEPSKRPNRLTQGLYSERLGGTDRRLVTRDVAQATDLVAAKRYVYWGGTHAVGRASINGATVQPQYLRLPRERGGGVEDGLAVSGNTLYLSQCMNSRIGRVSTESRPRADLINWFVTTSSCPQSIAVDGGTVYWVGTNPADDNCVLRASTRRTSGVTRCWANLGQTPPPLDLTADGDALYWLTQGTVSWIGRISAAKAIQPQLLRVGQGAISAYPG